jgi:hypothetical protein
MWAAQSFYTWMTHFLLELAFVKIINEPYCQLWTVYDLLAASLLRIFLYCMGDLPPESTRGVNASARYWYFEYLDTSCWHYQSAFQIMSSMQQAISDRASTLPSICQQLRLLYTKHEESLDVSQFRVLKGSCNIKKSVEIVN